MGPIESSYNKTIEKGNTTRMTTILSFDPSGNSNHDPGNEGWGTTGVAIERDGEIRLDEVQSEKFESTLDYWSSVTDYIDVYRPDYVVIEGYKLYNHAGMSANTQSNSTLMTSQLIGAIRFLCYDLNIPLTIQFASDVKTRWSDKVLQNLGILDGNKFDGKATNNHKRDALRHLMHFKQYKLKKLEESK